MRLLSNGIWSCYDIYASFQDADMMMMMMMMLMMTADGQRLKQKEG